MPAGAAQERGNRRLRLALALVSLLLVAAVAAGAVALAQRATARARERATAAQALDVKALTEPALDRSLLLARQAVALVDSPATRDNLLAALMRGPAAIGVRARRRRSRCSPSPSAPDGRTLAVAENDGTVRFYDAATRRPVARSYDDGKTAVPDRGYSPDTELRYSPDGTRLAVADSSFPSGGFIDLLDSRTHHRVARLTGEPRGAGGGAAPALEHVMFSRDSRVLIAETTSQDVGGQGNGIMKRWDARTGRRPCAARRRQAPHGDRVSRWRPTAHLARGDPRTGALRDASTLRPLRRLHLDRRPDRLDAQSRRPGRGDRRRRRQRAIPRSAHRQAAHRIRTPRRACTCCSLHGRWRHAGDGGRRCEGDGVGRRDSDAARNAFRARRHPCATSRSHRTARPHTPRASTAARSPGISPGRAASDDSSTPTPVDPGGPVGGGCGACGATTPDEGDLPPSVVATTPDGETSPSLGADGNVDLFDGSTLARTAVLPVNPGRRLFSVAIAPDGRTLAATTPFGEVSLWDLRTRRPLGTAADRARRTRLDADVQRATAAGWPPRARTGSSGSGTCAAAGRSEGCNESLCVDDVGLSPDGKTLAVTTGAERGEGSVEIYSVPRLIRTAGLAAPWGRWGRFSPDGRLLVVADHEGRLRALRHRDLEAAHAPGDRRTSRDPQRQHQPDSRTLATTSLDGSTRLWDLASGRPIGEGLPGPRRLRSAATFVRGGTHLVIAYDDGRAVLWDLRPSSWAARACTDADRTLTRDEWTDALPEPRYAPACRTR